VARPRARGDLVHSGQSSAYRLGHDGAHVVDAVQGQGVISNRAGNWYARRTRREVGIGQTMGRADLDPIGRSQSPLGRNEHQDATGPPDTAQTVIVKYRCPGQHSASAGEGGRCSQAIGPGKGFGGEVGAREHSLPTTGRQPPLDDVRRNAETDRLVPAEHARQLGGVDERNELVQPREIHLLTVRGARGLRYRRDESVDSCGPVDERFGQPGSS
jgi:hypothetical protein